MKNEQSKRHAPSILLAFVLGGATAFALMSRPAASHAAERVEPAVSVTTPIASEPGTGPIAAVADTDVCDLQLD